jgi:hypothetical protein
MKQSISENPAIPSPAQGQPSQPPQSEVPAPTKKKQRLPSRGERFTSAAQDLIDAIGQVRTAWEQAIGDVNTALEELRSVREEYESWRDNLPENLQSSALGEKLNAICDIDLDSEIDEPDFDTLEEAGQQCLDADLPQGFGRD